MASDFKYEFTDSASKDLDDILDYIANNLKNPNAAKDLFDGIKAEIKNICSFPLSAQEVENEFIVVQGVRRVTVGNYNLYYYPNESNNIITILRIIYGKRDLSYILRDLDV
jgi:plasmid stabilization system protein ParE